MMVSVYLYLGAAGAALSFPSRFSSVRHEKEKAACGNV